MSYFDACAVCGRVDVLVREGLCLDCNQDADRAALGGKPLKMGAGNGLRSSLAFKSRPLPEVEQHGAV